MGPCHAAIMKGIVWLQTLCSLCVHALPSKLHCHAWINMELAAKSLALSPSGHMELGRRTRAVHKLVAESKTDRV